MKITGNSQQRSIFYSIPALCAACCLLFLIGCATPLPKPPKYVYEDKKEEPVMHTRNSLFKGTAGLFGDRKASKVNDLLTITIDESTSSSGKADTKTSRESTADYDVTNFFGMNRDFNLHNNGIFEDFYKMGTNTIHPVFVPEVVGDGTSEYTGKGNTKREGTLTGTITAKVVEVMPNGNLVLESRKEITINREKEILILTGMVRPDDITTDNNVPSSKIADTRLYYLGDGVIQDKQGQGWLVQALDKIWPF
jgi:flagellar L-ring protein precursor FlgH